MPERPKSTLCPKGYAWCVEDCDIMERHCDTCDLPRSSRSYSLTSDNKQGHETHEVSMKSAGGITEN